MAYKTRDELLKEIETKNDEIKGLKEDIKKLERYEVYAEAADELAAARDIYVKAGFTKSEAFDLLLEMIKTAGAMNAGTKISYKSYR